MHLEVRFAGNKKLETSVGGHTIVTDQPVKDGGDNEGPTPFQLFPAGVAACMAHYANVFCEKRSIDTTGMSVSMDCDFDQQKKLYTAFRAELILPAGFPEKYESAILRAMEQCYVKKHIEQPPEISATARRA